MNAANLYAVLTLIAFALLLPAALAVEGGRFSAAWAAAIAKGYTRKVLCSTMLLSGLFYYLVSVVPTYICFMHCMRAAVEQHAHAVITVCCDCKHEAL
jgi:hypothetical protein